MTAPVERCLARTRRLWTSSGCLLAALLAVNGLLLVPREYGLRWLPGLLLYCLLPGYAAMKACLRHAVRGQLSRLVLAVSISFVLSSLAVLVLSALPGEMSLTGLALSLDVLVTLFVVISMLRSERATTRPMEWEVSEWPLFAGVLVVAGLLRFYGLGYSHFIGGDEVPLVRLATDIIAGRESAVLAHRKGPLESLVTVAFVLFDGGYREMVMRLPFAVASLAAVVQVYVLARRMISERAAIVAALLVGIEGMYLAVSRMQQYHGIVLLLLTGAVSCFWGARQADRDGRFALWVVGSALYGGALMAHYDAVVLAPVLALIVLTGGLSRRDAPRLIGCALLMMALAAPYYLPLLMDSRLGSVRTYVVQTRVGAGTGIHNNIGSLLSVEMLQRNSIYLVALMVLALTAGAWRDVRRNLPGFAATLCWGSFLAGLLLSLVAPNAVSFGPLNLTGALLLPLCGAIALNPRVPSAVRTRWLWFTTCLVTYGLLVRKPYLHWYMIVPPWALISATNIAAAIQWAARRVPRFAGAAIGIAAIALLAGYPFQYFVQQSPEYAETFPAAQSPLYWTPHRTILGEQGMGFQGTPRQMGWKSIGYLYRTGVLRGNLRVTNGADAAAWYLGRQTEQGDASRYIVYCNNEQSRRYEADRHDGLDRESIERFYVPIGRILVRGEPKLVIYEDRHTAAAGASPVGYSFEDCEAPYDRMATLDEQLARMRAGAGEDAFSQAAGLAQAIAAANPVVAFTDPRQVPMFSYHYTGNAPYAVASKEGPLWKAGSWLDERQAHDITYLLEWITNAGPVPPGHALPEGSGAVSSSWLGGVGLTVIDRRPSARLTVLNDTWVGDKIQLLGYEILETPTVSPLRLTLYWTSPIAQAEDFTVFVHVVDDRGVLVGQQDNQPARGARPTSGWRGQEVIRDDYEIAIQPTSSDWLALVGMYRADGGKRLPTRGQGVTEDQAIMLPLSGDRAK